MSVEVKPIEADDFLVKVAAATPTEHRVTLTDAYWNQIWNGRLPKHEVIARSFDFLLEREPKESILSSFDVTVISRYFPSFEREFSRYI